MARERMVTRTIEVSEYTIIAMDMSTLKGETITVSVPSAGTMSDKKRDDAIKKAVPSGKVFVAVSGESVKEVLYVMSEEDFIKYAKVQEGGR